MTAPKPGEKKRRTKSVFREYFELIAETAVFVFFVMTFVVQAFQIPTGSMEPTLLVGDFLLVNKFVYDNGTPPVDRLLLPRRDIKRNDIRGSVECPICHTLHHKDCWDITGTCQVPHLNG